MRNAKEELLETLEGLKPVCALIEAWGETKTKARLKRCYTDADWLAFLALLDFEYDAGYGGQNLFGLVWLEGGAWLERGEYDGSEWWEFKDTPGIPDELLYDPALCG